MHILITANTAWNIWNFRRAIVTSLLADGHTVTVLAPKDEAAPDLERLGCQLLDLKISPGGLNPIGDVFLLRRFRRIYREVRPDVVLSYTIKCNVFGALATMGTRTPFIPNVTGLGTAFLSGRLLQTAVEMLYRLAFRDLEVIYFQNSDDRAYFIERGLARVEQTTLLPGSGVDLNHFAVTPKPPLDAPPIF